MKNPWKVTTLALAAALTGVVAMHVASADQPHMQRAHEYAKGAHAELEAASPNKGGHRERAMEHIKAAEREISEGIEYARKNNL